MCTGSRPHLINKPVRSHRRGTCGPGSLINCPPAHTGPVLLGGVCPPPPRGGQAHRPGKQSLRRPVLPPAGHPPGQTLQGPHRARAAKIEVKGAGSGPSRSQGPALGPLPQPEPELEDAVSSSGLPLPGPQAQVQLPSSSSSPPLLQMWPQPKPEHWPASPPPGGPKLIP